MEQRYVVVLYGIGCERWSKGDTIFDQAPYPHAHDQAGLIERHPERRFKAAFNEYLERELPKLKEDVSPV